MSKVLISVGLANAIAAITLLQSHGLIETGAPADAYTPSAPAQVPYTPPAPQPAAPVYAAPPAPTAPAPQYQPPAAPPQAPAPAPAAAPINTAPGITAAQVAAAVQAYAKVHGAPAAKAVFAEFNAGAIAQIAPEHYQAVMDRVRLA